MANRVSEERAVMDYPSGDPIRQQKERDYWKQRGLDFLNSQRYLKTLLVKE